MNHLTNSELVAFLAESQDPLVIELVGRLAQANEVTDELSQAAENYEVLDGSVTSYLQTRSYVPSAEILSELEDFPKEFDLTSVIEYIRESDEDLQNFISDANY